ncbi:MAG: hypothetical protein JOY51_09035 [Nevskia sp.]|nr:hypothetical protein [Nevskia sp.]
MDRGRTLNPSKLPERCVSREPASGRLVLLLRGRPGLHYIQGERKPEEYNRAMGLSYEQVEAMEYGALFGYDADLADPEQVRKVREEMGLPVGPIKEAAPEAPRPVAPKPAPRPEMPEDVGNFAPWFQEALAQTKKRPASG